MVEEKLFHRIICPVCSYFAVHTVCPRCYKRIQGWIKANPRYTCENCNKKVHTKDAWSAYEDVRT